MRRFKGFNAGREWNDQIKPFNFYLVGFQAVEEDGNAVKPLAPYSNDPQKVVYEPFIDYETGYLKEGSHYFKPLSRTIGQYVEHPEHKFNGEVGILERKHVHADGVVYIGKEANNIDEQELDVKQAQVFVDVEEVKRKILSLTPAEARKIGIKYRSTLKKLKDRVRGGEFKLDTKEIRKIVGTIT
ncbi:hypothetical protein [Methanococcoides methylutens]|uniref:hypothetical protein n=1 Tax=Methanococcoides methylutens TaxID=2226 RepID=UPI000AE5853A|nr:hypothetical protein [Methanococcoides methylutens]